MLARNGHRDANARPRRLAQVPACHAEHFSGTVVPCETTKNATPKLCSYGRGFGLVGPLLGDESPLNVPNGFYGIFYYFLVAGLSLSNNIRVARLTSYLTGLSNLLSIYLAYLLYFVLEDLCIVCVTTYGVNLISLILALQKVQILVREDQVMRVIKKEG
ncbi:vitamin-K-epoxide reductase [Culex quinquefasciatus]|uniref:vitamin-K-epoxide reductase (warfarin-sensitive) n=1 Tax=Culex quinquefasciatus TaxID=7176 RepID=B0W9K5_CULQU|nr:vitamin-K-epoxide reductase [Culex quinquefasciatus]|eukprot:XP_001845389.1 vitamin-K-epoxide reductase [Culex quinquefasciatus]